MKKLIKKTLTYTVIIIILSAFTGTEQGVKFEAKYGLPLLYKLRNAYAPPIPPANVFIITPYKTRKAGMPDALRDWDRREHANIIRKLSELGVAVIAMDMFFRDPHPQEDEAFANEIKHAGNVILNQLARPIDYVDNRVKENILRNPVEPLASSTQMLAPTLVLSDQSRIDAFFSFYQVIYDRDDHHCFGYRNDADLKQGSVMHYGGELGTHYVATLPVAAMEQYLISQGKLQNIIQSSAGSTKAAQSVCDYRVDARKSLANNPVIINQLKLDSKDDDALGSWLMLVEQLSLQNLRRVKQPSFNLNFYGSPQTLHTLDYEELLNDYSLISTKNKDNRFQNSVVFIGGSFNEPADQIIDDFNTVFTKGELPMSGVEVAATAFANLHEKNYLTRHTKRDAFLTTLFVSLCIALLAFITTNKKFIFFSIALAISYSAVSVYQFSAYYYWLPFVIPIAAIVLIMLYELFDRFYLTSKDKTKLEKNLKLYLSSTVANQVSENKEFELEQAICLVTDVTGFATLGEALAPEKLHVLNRAYFELLFNCVTEYGVDVIKTYGDSLTAVWKVKDQSSYSQAVEAGLEILSRIEIFNAENHKTPFETRLGLSSGQIVIGYVGGQTHRTVELTGNAIYTASRLEQLNKETNTKFLSTQELIAQTQRFQINVIGKKQLRGKSEYTDIVEVVSKK